MINAIKFSIEEIEASDQYFDHTGNHGSLQALTNRPDQTTRWDTTELGSRPLGRLFGFHALSAARRAAYVASGSEDIDLK